ncbi:MAG: COR domain-containing protein [Geminicoccaceae bacterium]
MPKIPIIVVLNKIKQYPFHLNTQFIQQHYNNAKFFVETDCADDTGIERLAQAISHEIRQLPNLRNRFPFSWFEIRDRLEQDTRDYITFDDFRQLCIEYDETNNADQDNLAAFLHRLGVIVNFRDDPRLHDTHVLKPKWLTQGIYAVLTSQLLVSQQGELHINDLRAILPSDQYPISQLPFLVEMMRKFDLCIRFPDDEMRFLIPQALPKDEPPELGKLEVEQGLRFEYRYTTVLPEGLIPRFIVRTSSLSTDQTRWRTGVILRFEGNLALVKADPLSRSVQVYIHGQRRP